MLATCSGLLFNDSSDPTITWRDDAGWFGIASFTPSYPERSSVIPIGRFGRLV
jgi:hypothetical protein